MYRVEGAGVIGERTTDIVSFILSHLTRLEVEMKPPRTKVATALFRLESSSLCMYVIKGQL